MRITSAFVTFILAALPAIAQDFPIVSGVEPQPLLSQAQRLVEALHRLGSPLAPEDVARVSELVTAGPSAANAEAVQRILDPYCIAFVDISAEARTKAEAGPAPKELTQHGWRSFLVKVHNQANLRSALNVTSPNADVVLHHSSGQPNPRDENEITEAQVANRFLELAVYRRAPLTPTLTGLGLEYVVLQVYTREQGKREAMLAFDAGQGTADIGARDAIPILFDCRPAVKVVFDIKDFDGSPTTASLLIRDNIERLVPDGADSPFPGDYRVSRAERRPWEGNESPAKRLTGIYPMPSRRVAMLDEYPDFYFQPQIYRMDGEHVDLPPGDYDITVTRGPEYLEQNHTITVPPDIETTTVPFKLERWIHMAALGWYSGDHHVHAGGCSHYESPEAGVQPHTMFRQALGEDLNVSCVLSWGPCWYHQKTFFEGKDHALSTDINLMRYDVEVSGFPSSHAGHLCLLRLKEDDYPGTTKIEEWPSWTLPVLQWGQSQGAVVGYSHSGWGLEPTEPTSELPNYVLPKMDGIGANEYIVTVAHGACDFISSVDTPAPWELNIWYHTLNCGYRARISGETDFPCIYDERIGMGRSYAPLEDLTFDAFTEQLKNGANYVSDGMSHIIDFSADGIGMGEGDSEVELGKYESVIIQAKVAARLPETQDTVGNIIANRAPEAPPYWHLERARIGDSRKVPVELLVNGYPVETVEIEADGAWNDLKFTYTPDRSSWIALRILYSSHTNPIFLMVDEHPIRASKKSAQWCIDALEQCWSQKQPRIRLSEREAARAAYDQAKAKYEEILAEAAD